MSVSGKAKREEGIINTNNNVGHQLDVSPLSRGKREIGSFCIKVVKYRAKANRT